jgi:hypothetical protein
LAFLEENCRNYEEFADLLVEIGHSTNEKMGQELVAVIGAILKLKLKDFEEISSGFMDIIPKMDRIFGDEDEETFVPGEWQLNYDLED